MLSCGSVNESERDALVAVKRAALEVISNRVCAFVVTAGAFLVAARSKRIKSVLHASLQDNFPEADLEEWPEEKKQTQKKSKSRLVEECKNREKERDHSQFKLETWNTTAAEIAGEIACANSARKLADASQTDDELRSTEMAQPPGLADDSWSPSLRTIESFAAPPGLTAPSGPTNPDHRLPSRSSLAPPESDLSVVQDSEENYRIGRHCSTDSAARSHSSEDSFAGASEPEPAGVVCCAFAACTWRGPVEEYEQHTSACDCRPAPLLKQSHDRNISVSNKQFTRQFHRESDGASARDYQWQKVTGSKAKDSTSERAMATRRAAQRSAQVTSDHKERVREVPRRRRKLQPVKFGMSVAKNGSTSTEVLMTVPCGPNAHRILRVPIEDKIEATSAIDPLCHESPVYVEERFPPLEMNQFGTQSPVSDDEATQLALAMSLSGDVIRAGGEPQVTETQITEVPRAQNTLTPATPPRDAVLEMSVMTAKTCNASTDACASPDIDVSENNQRRKILGEWRIRKRDPRSELIRAVFRACDADGNGRLTKDELHRFAVHTGFDGGNDDWAEEYNMLCEERSCNPSEGLCARRFVELVNDNTETGCPCTDEELRRILAACVQ